MRVQAFGFRVVGFRFPASFQGLRGVSRGCVGSGFKSFWGLCSGYAGSEF